MTKDYIIFTDGASSGNPGPGGWGAIIADAAHVQEIGGGETHTTNNRMELTAVYEALVVATRLAFDSIIVYSDSSYVIQGATQWGNGWRMRGWITSTKAPVLNRDLWEPLLELLDVHGKKISWKNVGGHVGIPGNERVDEIATSFSLQKNIELYDGLQSEYTVDVTIISADASLANKKSESRTRSKQTAYSYVSEVDGKVLTHKTWGECEARVKGKRARFKKALSASEKAEIIKSFSH